MPKKTLEQEIQELISKVEPLWGQPIVREIKQVESTQQSVTSTIKLESKPTSKEIEGAKLLRYNKRGKTAVVVLDDQVQVIFKFPGKQELKDFISWFE